MSEKILCVDDEPNVLDSIKRCLRKTFTIDTAQGGREALKMIADNDPYAVIISDMSMPVMNGVEFLTQAKRTTPNSVRMMLTGNADQLTAVAAVNEGDVFRFLNKPCDPARLKSAINAGLSHYRLILAEQELLENTLRGCVGAMSEVLSLTSPSVFGRTARIRSWVCRLADRLDLDDPWKLETAVSLSQIGCVAVPRDIVRKRAAAEPMTLAETREFLKHTDVGARLVANIPRMEDIAECIQYQEKNFDGSGYPEDDRQGHDIPLGARLLRIVTEFDACEHLHGPAHALSQLKDKVACYDPNILSELARIVENEDPLAPQQVRISALTDDMILAEDIYTTSHILLAPKGMRVSESVRGHLRSFQDKGLIDESVNVTRQQEEHGT